MPLLAASFFSFDRTRASLVCVGDQGSTRVRALPGLSPGISLTALGSPTFMELAAHAATKTYNKGISAALTVQACKIIDLNQDQKCLFIPIYP